MHEGPRRLLSGWGRTSPSRAQVLRPAAPDEVAKLLMADGRGGLIARGLGRSYNDAAQCAGGTVLETTGLDAIGPIDPATGDVIVGAGVSLQDLIFHSLPKGWFVPVSPGTRLVTVGGAIAADVHGKNHHRDGGFAEHVRRLGLATPTGVHDVGPDGQPELFWATAGGMGLTGVITEATIRMIPVDTGWMVVDTDRFDDLDALMDAMATADARYRYSVAWLDSTATGRRLGRGVLTSGEHARMDDLDEQTRGRARVPPPPARLAVPLPSPLGFFNRLSISAFNEAWFRRAPRHRRGELQTIGTFFHPLDGVGNWNLLYGPKGFVQYQMAVGPDEGETVRRVLELLAQGGAASFVSVLKRFGPADPGLLSFPRQGWTLALDYPVGAPNLPGLLDRADELVAEVGGRVYLAKDARVRPDRLAAMYPRLDELRQVRRRVDPDGRLVSDLARRLGLAEHPPAKEEP